MSVYRQKIANGDLYDDAEQRLAVEKLQLLHARLHDYNPVRPKTVRLGLFGWGRERMADAPIPGLYLYGGVGRGKSMLMDLFFETIEIEPKRRVHFHAFMQEVHSAIKQARVVATKDPIPKVAEQIARSATVLCFDEMQITDITDAMLVGRLFEALFAKGVIIVTTSNRHPDDLYKHGLNRALFLPFIEMIKQRLDVHHIESGDDYRRTVLAGQQTYFTPLTPEATVQLDALWQDLTGGQDTPLNLVVSGRTVTLPRHCRSAARADFDTLCATALGPADYLAIAAAVKTLFMENIPLLSSSRNNEAKRFVTLIDALYEARVQLIATAAASPEELYVEGAGAFEFERTASSLHEMQGADWSG